MRNDLEAPGLLKLKKTNLHFFKYVLLATTNLLIYYAIFSCLVYVSGDYVVSASVASILSLIINFMALKNVFFKKTTSGISMLFPRYLAVYFVCYVFNLSLLRICSQFNVNIYVGGLIILPPSALLGYSLVRKFVFTNALNTATR